MNDIIILKKDKVLDHDAMVKSLVVNPDKCTGCRLCELACSYRHFKVMNPARSRIHVVRRPHEAIDTPIFCLQCGLCISACPFNALSRDLKTGAIKVDESKCTGCGECVHVCPYGAATIDPVNRKALICDLCGGDPECVKVCPENALLFLDANQAAKYKQIAFSKLQRKELTALMPDRR